MIYIKVVQVKLLDESSVYNVEVRDDDGTPIVLHATTQQDAETLAQMVVDGIGIHTTEEATVIDLSGLWT